jgi:VWFA-related protein
VSIDNKPTRRSLLCGLSLFPAARLLSGQQIPVGEQTPKYSADVKLVNLFATVRDKEKKIVKDLTKDNFSLDEEGRSQTIKFFEAETSLPLNLGMLVDTSGSQAGVLGKERSAGIKFFDQILREDKDQAFVIHFDYESELLQDFTSSRQKLEQSLDQLAVARPQQGQTQQQGGGYPQGGQRYPQGGGGGGTKLYDAILLASNDLMSKQTGRKALILLTDGVDTGSRVTLFQGISAAQKADTLVYSVLFSDPEAYGSPVYYPSPGMGRRGRMPMPMPPPGGGQDLPDGKKVLRQIAEETGGRFYQVGRFYWPLDMVFADIEEELRNQYNIGYTPDKLGESGEYRKIHLTAKTNKKKDLVVQTRAGYYTQR